MDQSIITANANTDFNPQGTHWLRGLGAWLSRLMRQILLTFFVALLCYL